MEELLAELDHGLRRVMLLETDARITGTAPSM